MSVDIAPPLCEGRYRLIKILGTGGMATVYKAFDDRLEIFRAIKVLAPALANRASIRKRFESEARTMAKIHHRNIVTVHDVGVDQSHHGIRPFIVMEMVSGGSLLDHIRTHGPMPPKQAATVTRDLLLGLHIAHSKGVVHRDMKPHNVLVNVDGVPKLTDFGIAHVDDDKHSMTTTGAVMGTWAYMAPEQRTDAKNVDGRADIYATTGTLYALLTNKEPFDLWSTQLHEELFADLPPELGDIIAKGCSYKPDDRFPSASEMATALDDSLVDLPENPEDMIPLGHDCEDEDTAEVTAALSIPPSGDYAPHGSTLTPMATMPSAAGGAATFAFGLDDDMDVMDDMTTPPIQGFEGAGQRPATETPNSQYTLSQTVPPAAAVKPRSLIPTLIIGGMIAAATAGAVVYVVNQANLAAEEKAALRAEINRGEVVRAAEKRKEAIDKEKAIAESLQAEVAALKAEAERQEAALAAASAQKYTAKKSTPSKKTAAPVATKTVVTPKKKEKDPSVTGSVALVSKPYGDVYLDGKKVGTTPHRGKYPAGEYEMLIEDKSGRKHKQKLINRANRTTKLCWDYDSDAICSR